ncbi:MAG: benzoate-CoA ligase family protein [Hyphomicrobiales bacterium]|nr:benzoate-CoA ligase family protein [Hyphomicrobiales bacterium]
MSEASYNATVDFIDRHVGEGRGDKTAVIDDAGEYSYAQLAERANRGANLATGLGLDREARVALLMLDAVDWLALFWGSIKAGIIPVCLNTLLTTEQYRYILQDCRAKALFVSAALLPKVEPILDELPALEHIVVHGGDAGGHLALDALMGDAAADFEAVATDPDETAFWLYSSGSTGMPKGTMHRQTSMRYTADTYGTQVLGIRTGDTVFSAAKLFFAYGLGNSMTFPLSVGATLVLMAERPTPAAVMNVLKRTNPTIFFGVPTLYAAMLADPACSRENGSNRLRLCVSAGEALPEEVGKRWRERFGVDILDGVGSTELLHIFLSNRPDDVNYGTSGVAVPGYGVRLVDEEGNDVPEGEIGELIVEGESAASGYWNQREKSRTTFAGRWTWTGDKYFQDDKGYYHICGRSDDMFKVSGIWVSPYEVEAALIGHEAVVEAAVIPRADEEGLLKPMAFVIFKEGVKPDKTLFDELKEQVKAKAGPWKYPRWIEACTELPKTATGKIQRFKLRQDG